MGFGPEYTPHLLVKGGMQDFFHTFFNHEKRMDLDERTRMNLGGWYQRVTTI